MVDPVYLAAVGRLLSDLVRFAEENECQVHVGRRERGGWTVAVEWVVEVENRGLEARSSSGIGEGLGEALAQVSKDLNLGAAEPVRSTLPADVAEAYVLGRNTGYSAAHAAAETTMKSLADELSKRTKELEECNERLAA